MNIYNYSPLTYEFIDQSEARLDPLEEGNYLIPANSTIIKPLQSGKNEVVVFNKEINQWEIKADFRGQVFWNKQTKEKIIITQIGLSPDETLTNLEPGVNDVWQKDRWQADIELWKNNFVRKKRDFLINEYDWMIDRHKQQKELVLSNIMNPGNPDLTDSQYLELLQYFQELRDLPETINYENPVFPTKPSFTEPC